MNLTAMLNRTMHLVKDHTPAILTAFGAAGVISTAYLTHKAALKSAHVIYFDGLGREEGYIYTKREIFDLTWQYYLPPVLMGVATISCVVGAQAVNARRQAALIGAYTVAERAFNEYKEKVIETVGDKKEQGIREEIAKDRIEASKEDSKQIVISGANVLCYDVISGRYFQSDIETLRRAMNDINEQCINSEYASLNEFYSKVGLPQLPMGETMGWNTTNMLELKFSYIPSEDGRPTLAVEFREQPKMEYYKAVW